MRDNLTPENLPKPESTLETESIVPIESIPQTVIDQTKYNAYEQGKKSAKEELGQQPNNSVSTSTSVPLTTEDVHNIITSHTGQQANEWQAQQIAQQFLSKLMAAKDKYPDFEETLASLEVHKFPEVVQLANNFDNTADIMYELAKNPSKAVILKQCAQLNPNLATIELQCLSDSIKQNQTAKQGSIAQPPLSQLTRSVTKTDNGLNNVGDYRKQSWLRA